MLQAADWITAGVTVATIFVCVLLHFEGLRLISDYFPKPKWHPRRRTIFLIFAVLLLHFIEVWIFGVVYWYFLGLDGYGKLMGIDNPGLIDCVYFSAAVFSTVGFGDLYPHGAIRIIAGFEAIAGLTLITWSASYTFVEMLKTWEPDVSRDE
jgi:hypothetical protein